MSERGRRRLRTGRFGAEVVAGSRSMRAAQGIDASRFRSLRLLAAIVVMTVVFWFPQTATAVPTTSLTPSPPVPDGAAGWYTTPFTVTLDMGEPGVTYWQLDATDEGGWNTYLLPLTPPDGQHTLYYFSVDSLSETETVKSQSYKLDTTPPSASAGSDRVLNEGDTSTYDASASSDAESPVTVYEWDWTSDGAYERVSGSPSVTHAYPQIGLKTATLRVTNEAGLSSTDILFVTVNDIPGLSFASMTNDADADIQAEYDYAGNRVAWVCGAAGNPDIWVMNANATGKTQLTTSTFSDQHPSFSPDGTKIVFTSYRSGAGDVYVMDSDGSGQTQLTTDGAFDGYPNFSPDGSKITFVSARGGTWDVWVMNADGSGQTQLTSDPAEEWTPDFSPDGTKIAFTSDKAGNKDIWLMDADGSNQSQLTTDPALDQHPSFRGDGSRIAFFSERAGDANLFTMALNGTDLQQVTSGTSYDWIPYWDKSQDRFVYSTNSEGNDNLWIVYVPIPGVATSLSADPPLPNGQNGWYVTDPRVTLNRSGAGTTYYSLAASSGPWTEYTGPFNVGEGQQTVWYRSFDASGVGEAVKAQPFKVDTVVPAVSFGSPSAEASVSGSVVVVGTASDANFVSYSLEYGSGKRPLNREPDVDTLESGTWWRPIASSASPVSGGTLGTWDTTVLDNSYHTLRLVAVDQAGNTSVQWRPVKTDNAGRAWLEEVTVDPFDYVPDVSADGTKIAFTSDRLGNYDIWVSAPDGTLLYSVAQSPAQDKHPSFSPDGQSVVFGSDRGGNFDIWKVDLDGTGLTQLTSGPGDETVPTWSHDGSKIAYVSDAGGNRDVFVMNADGSGQTQLTSDPATDWLPDISADGSKVAFHSDRLGSRDIFVVNTDGTGLARVTSFPSAEMHPSFSPDGQTLVFHRGLMNNCDIWTIGVDGSDPRKLTTDAAQDALPTWSPNGGKIVFMSTRTGMADIYSMNADGSNQQRLTFSVDDFIPDVTASGSKVAFASTRARDYGTVNYGSMLSDIYLVDADGSDMSLLTSVSSHAYHPSFSPDGQQVSFVSDEGGNRDVWKIGVDGTGRTRLTSTPSAENVPTWGPNGRIAFVSDAIGTDDIWAMNADGSSAGVVTSTAALDRFPDVAPDGRIGFSSNQFGPGDVFTVAPDGSALTRLTPDNAANEWHPSYGPGGSRMAFMISAANTDLFTMRLDGSDRARLTYDAALDTVETWGADGRTMVFSTSRTSGDASRKSIWRMAVEPDPDGQPPLTALSRSPLDPDGDNGWFRTPPTLTLSANEAATTYWQSDSTSTAGWHAYLAPLTVPEGEHRLYYFSVDSEGNTETVRTCLGSKVDISAPSTVTLSGSAAGPSSVDLAWSEATDAVSGVAGYRVYNADTASVIASPTSAAATVSGLSEETTYRFYVRSIDVAGNLSAPGNTVVVATPRDTANDSTSTVTSGEGVSASAGAATIVFDSVSAPGDITVHPASNPHGGPANFQLVGGGYYDISTTASFTGTATISLQYDPAQLAGSDENALRLFHWKAGTGWEDITTSIDTVNNTITGETTSLSPFGIFGPLGGGSGGPVTNTPASSTWSLVLLAAIGLGVAAVRHRKTADR